MFVGVVIRFEFWREGGNFGISDIAIQPYICYNKSMKKSTFEWDENKNSINKEKHNVSFERAQHAFKDTKRIIAEDLDHSNDEKRYFCFGEVDGGILTVRFTYRDKIIRIIGAGYWRKGKKIYEKNN